MKPSPLRRAWPLVVSSVLLGGAFAIAACVDDETPPGAAGPDGSTPNPDQDAATSTTDGSTPVDAGAAEEFADGGDLPPEDDGGTTDLDGGFDAGPACQLLTSGAFVDSTCVSRISILAGGKLTTTNYKLDSLRVLGTAAFCGDGGAFVPYQHRGALEVTATSDTTATFEFLDQYRKSGAIVVRPSTTRYDVAVTATGTQLAYTAQPCALKAPPPTAAYSVGATKDGKKTITLQLPYGTKGSARYLFIEQ